MRLLFKQRMFSWFDSYDIYNEDGETVYTVEGKLSWGHCLHILNEYGEHIATVQEKVMTLFPRFELYENDEYLGSIRKEWSLFSPRYFIDFNGWQIKGNVMEWDYTILDEDDLVAAEISKELWNWTDTYIIDVVEPSDALYALMVVLAIDAEKCSRD